MQSYVIYCACKLLYNMKTGLHTLQVIIEVMNVHTVNTLLWFLLADGVQG